MNSFEQLIPFILLEQLFKAVYDKHWTSEFIYLFFYDRKPATHTHTHVASSFTCHTRSHKHTNPQKQSDGQIQTSVRDRRREEGVECEKHAVNLHSLANYRRPCL